MGALVTECVCCGITLVIGQEGKYVVETERGEVEGEEAMIS